MFYILFFKYLNHNVLGNKICATLSIVNPIKYARTDDIFIMNSTDLERRLHLHRTHFYISVAIRYDARVEKLRFGKRCLIRSSLNSAETYPLHVTQ